MQETRLGGRSLNIKKKEICNEMIKKNQTTNNPNFITTEDCENDKLTLSCSVAFCFKKQLRAKLVTQKDR